MIHGSCLLTGREGGINSGKEEGGEPTEHIMRGLCIANNLLVGLAKGTTLCWKSTPCHLGVASFRAWRQKGDFGPPPEGRPLRARQHKRVTLNMVWFVTTEATIKSKHSGREELFLIEKHMFLATVADGQIAASWGEGKKNCKHSP